MVKTTSPVMRNDVLLDIATFLARRWSGNDKVVVIFIPDKPPTAKLDKNQIILSLLNYYPGTDFQKYRQWRVALWFESMRMKHSSKVLSNEHAFGFLLNTLETKRIKILELDPLVSIPILSPRTRVGASLNQSDMLKQVEKVVQMRHKKDDVQKKIKEVYEGHDVLQEFETLIAESKKTESKGYESLENFGLSVPDKMDLDETQIYDIDLIQKVKAAFRDWKPGWIEQHDESGDEFDVETYIEALPKTFLADFKLSIKTKVVILLDHSSSIADVELEYKQATIALCEALHYLGIKFAVYAFSTDKQQVKCWVVKPPNIKWSVVSARRLVQIRASGGTPLAEVYGLLLPMLKSFKPDIFVTLTDGEPSDFDAVRQMVLSYRKMAIHMMAIGVGRNLNDSVGIGHNLKYLDYEKAISVSRLQDIPKKVIKLLRSN